MKKQPRQMIAKFDGTCDECGRRVEAGENILWLERGVIHCEDCMQTPNDTPDAIQDDSWASALAWDTKQPQPVASSPQANIRRVTAAADKAPVQRITKPAKPVVVDFTRSETGERPELDLQAQTVCDLLVTLINAVDRLTSDQRHAIYCHALDFGRNSASESRAKLWREFAQVI